MPHASALIAMVIWDFWICGADSKECVDRQTDRQTDKKSCAVDYRCDDLLLQVDIVPIDTRYDTNTIVQYQQLPYSQHKHSNHHYGFSNKLHQLCL